MKKFTWMIALAIIMVCLFGFQAGADILTGTTTTTITQSIYTNYVQVGGSTFGMPVSSSPRYRVLDKIVVKNNTGSSSSTAVATLDIDDWTTLNGSPIVAATTAQTIAYPVRSVTETVTGGYAVTNYPVAVVNGGMTITTGDVVVVQSPTTNYYMQSLLVATTETVTKNEQYWVNRLRLITTLDATNAVSTIKWAVEFH